MVLFVLALHAAFQDVTFKRPARDAIKVALAALPVSLSVANKAYTAYVASEKKKRRAMLAKATEDAEDAHEKTRVVQSPKQVQPVSWCFCGFLLLPDCCITW
jgi:hypothetical protein